MTVSYLFYLIKSIPTLALVCWVVSNSIHIFMLSGTGMFSSSNVYPCAWMLFIFSRRVATGRKVHIVFPFLWNLYSVGFLNQWVADGRLYGVLALIDELRPYLNSLEINILEIIMTEENISLIKPIHPFLLFPDHYHILEPIPLITITICFRHYI